MRHVRQQFLCYRDTVNTIQALNNHINKIKSFIDSLAPKNFHKLYRTYLRTNNEYIHEYTPKPLSVKHHNNMNPKRYINSAMPLSTALLNATDQLQYSISRTRFNTTLAKYLWLYDIFIS